MVPTLISFEQTAREADRALREGLAGHLPVPEQIIASLPALGQVNPSKR